MIKTTGNFYNINTPVNLKFIKNRREKYKDQMKFILFSVVSLATVVSSAKYD